MATKNTRRGAKGLPAGQVDDSGQGAPMLAPAAGLQGRGAAGAAPSSAPGDLIVEVEFAPGAQDVATALAADSSQFFAGAAQASAPGGQLAGVLHQFGMRDARAVFSPERIARDQEEVTRLRAAAVTGAATPEQLGARERLPGLSQYVRLRFPAGTPAREVTAALRRLPEVVAAVRVPRALPPEMAQMPADPLIGDGSAPVRNPATGLESQWYLHRTRAPQAWRHARGANVVVADIDWGFRTTHRDLREIERKYNAVDGGSDVTRGSHAAHGTAVMGIAAARSNASGIAGYAPEASLWAIQGDSAPGATIFTEPWAEGIDYVRRTDAGGRRKVIILEVQTGEYGNYEQVPSVHRAVRAAIADGCVVCVAAGNGNRAADRTDDGDPFDPTGSILVGATAYDPGENRRASFSNFGSRIVVSAPGDPDHDLTCGQASDTAYRNGFGGTSGATPKVAGTAALMLSVHPRLTHADVRDILAATGSPVAEDPGKPVGVFLNTAAAVAEALRRRSESPEPAGPHPAPQPAHQPLHGLSRRHAQFVLPRDSAGPLRWDDEDADDDGSTVGPPPAAPGELPPKAGDKPLRLFRESVEGTLTQQDRILIVEQAIQMLDNFYVHRPLKEAMHAVRPIQRLRVLLRRMQPMNRARHVDEPVASELAFHNKLTQIFNSVRDLHTGYALPRPYRDYIAYVPFEVAAFYENGERRYVVTRVASGYQFTHPSFGVGAEICYWNGMTIERAVRANADQTAGSNDAARHARGVSALTLRPMNTALPPEADFVDLEFVPAGADARDPAARQVMRQAWFVRYAPATIGTMDGSADRAAPQAQQGPAPGRSAPSAIDIGRESTARAGAEIFDAEAWVPPDGGSSMAPSEASPSPLARELALASLLGIDSAADAVREARQLIFEADAWRESRGTSVAGAPSVQQGSASPPAAAEPAGEEENMAAAPWKLAFRARKERIDGVEYGCIHIRTFHVPDADGFVAEFIRLLGQMPPTGLVLDVRGNGGGNIWAAERLLQTLTAGPIDPEATQFIISAGTLDLCRNNPEQSPVALHRWLPSVEEGVETGAVYSHAFPLTTPDSCNGIGQRYYGPVVLLVDGNCYSATDMFAAGFQDHGVGKVLGVSHATGAGGANVWEHRLLTQVLPTGWGLKPLPGQAGMRVAIRQCLRRNGGLLEDFGVVPDAVHLPTRADVLQRDRDLLAEAASILRGQPLRSIQVQPGPLKKGKRSLKVATTNLRRLDIYVDGRPQASLDLHTDANGGATLDGFSIEPGLPLRLYGFADVKDARPAAEFRGSFQ